MVVLRVTYKGGTGIFLRGEGTVGTESPNREPKLSTASCPLGKSNNLSSISPTLKVRVGQPKVAATLEHSRTGSKQQ